MPITRRGFLQGTAAAALVLPGCGNEVGSPPRVDAVLNNDPTDDQNNGTVRVSLVTVPDLLLVPSAITLRLGLLLPERPSPVMLPDPPELLVVHRGQIGSADEWIAVDSACPHAGCPLGYAPSVDTIACPCHSSQFRAAAAGPSTCVGQVMHEPSHQDVRAYQVALDPRDTKTLVIDLKQINGCDTVRLPPIVGGKVTLPIADFPALGQKGGSVIGRPMGATQPIAVVRVSDASDDTAVVALSAVCTHRGCTVAYSDGSMPTSCGTVAGGGFWCSCHCSEFAIDGRVLLGPAALPLPNYNVTFDGTTVTILVV